MTQSIFSPKGRQKQTGNCPRQVFFPLSGDRGGWERLKRALRLEIDEELMDRFKGTESLPFKPESHRKIAVKIIDDRGIESLVIKPLE